MADETDKAKGVIQEAESRATKVLDVASQKALDIIESARISALRQVAQTKEMARGDIDDSDVKILGNDIKYIRSDVADIKRKLEGEYVTTKEFSLVRNLVFAMVGLILVAFFGAVISLVIKSHS